MWRLGARLPLRGGGAAPPPSRRCHQASPRLRRDAVHKYITDAMGADLRAVQQLGRDILGQHIRSPGMLDISTYYYRSPGDSWLIWTGLQLALAKALQHHLLGTDQLSWRQQLAVALVELSMTAYLLHDDLVDNSEERFRQPAAHLLWPQVQVALTGNYMIGVTLTEAARLGREAVVTVGLMHEGQVRGQLLTELNRLPADNRMAGYILATDYKAGCLFMYFGRLVAQASGGSDLLHDNASKIFYNLGVLLQLLDDFKDTEVDVAEGVPTASLLYASRKHPEIDAMVLRRFREPGDTETALRMILESGGLDQTRELILCHHALILQYLNTLTPSPHRDSLQLLIAYQVERKLKYYGILTERLSKLPPLGAAKDKKQRGRQ